MTIAHGGSYAEPGATASDLKDGTRAVTVGGSVNSSLVGSYLITYTASDIIGNTSTTTRVVNVTDQTAPLITLNGDSIVTMPTGGSYSEAGATATDAVDGSVAVTISGSVNTSVVGTYVLTYSAKDAGGNTAISVQRTVQVAAPLGTTYIEWLNGASASDSAFLDYVFGAVTPGTLDASLKPTVAVTGGNLVLTYYTREGTAGLTVTPKTTADLAAGAGGWSTAGVEDVAEVAPITVNGVSVRKHRAGVPVIGVKNFLRIEAVQQ
jgi:hypothetical protein